jgi:hypothetical protein
VVRWSDGQMVIERFSDHLTDLLTAEYYREMKTSSHARQRRTVSNGDDWTVSPLISETPTSKSQRQSRVRFDGWCSSQLNPATAATQKIPT